MISFSCQGCGHNYKVKDDFGGKRVRCKKCNHTMNIPDAVKETETPPKNDSVVMAVIVDEDRSDNKPYEVPQEEFVYDDETSTSYMKIIIPAVVISILGISGIFYLAFRDTWEKDNYSKFFKWSEKAKALNIDGKYDEALWYYQEILKEIGHREIKKDYMKSLVFDVRNKLLTTQSQIKYKQIVKRLKKEKLKSFSDDEIFDAREIFTEIASSGNLEAIHLLGLSFSIDRPNIINHSKAFNPDFPSKSVQ